MSFFEKKRLPELALFLLAIVLYANTLRHSFVLDDNMVLVQNNFVKQGTGGIPAIFSNDTFAGYARLAGQDNALPGGRYRPLSLAVFAVLYGVFGENEAVFHGLAILLYAFTGVLLFRLLRRMLNDTPQAGKLAWLVACLFVAHPIHTEVVANVKSCDEQLALLLGMGAWLAVFHAYDFGKKRSWLAAGLLFFGACLSKENAVLLAFMVPLSLWFFRKTNPANALRHALPLFAVMAVFLLLRAAATTAQAADPAMASDPLNNPFLEWSGSAWIPCPLADRAATVVYLLGQQLRLLTFPHPLTHDYYHLELQSFSNAGVWVSLVLLASLLVYGLRSIRQRHFHQPPGSSVVQAAGFGVLFLLFTMGLTANVFFPVGAFMAERFLYLPSVGFCLTAVIWGNMFFEKYAPRFFGPFFGAVLLVFAALTVLRNPAWKTNEALARTGIAHSANSAKLNNDLGTLIVEKAMQEKKPAKRRPLFEEAYPYLQRALERHPTYFDAYLAHGACSYYLGKYDAAVSSYRSAYKLYPHDPKSRTGLQYSLQTYADDLGKKSQHIAAIAAMTEAWQLRPDTLSATHLSAFYHANNQLDKAVEWLEKAQALAPNDMRLKDALEKARLEFAQRQ